MLRRSFYKKPTKKRYFVIQQWNKRLTVSALFFAVIRFVIVPIMLPIEQTRNDAVAFKDVDLAVRMVCMGLRISEDKIKSRPSGAHVFIPSKLTFYRLVKLLEEQLSGTGAKILECRQDGDKSFVLDVGSKQIKYTYTFNIQTADVARARIAVIIDDFGYSLNSTVKKFLSFKRPITISIIPGLRQSKKIAQLAKWGQKDFLIHMPMEPMNGSFKDDGYILLTIHEPDILQKRLEKAITALPYAVGMNNHQGSRATSDPHLMNVVMKTVKDHNLLFVDSRTSASSVAYRVARQNAVPAAQNHLFLDQEDSRDYIRGQVKKLADLAFQNTKVLAIGHVRPSTLAVLEESIEYLELRGVEFVSISQYLNL